MKSLVAFLLLITFSSAFSCYAFFDRDVHVLNMQNGLADNTVLSIYKDRDGFMWFGTSNGLSRYDGRNMKTFRTDDSELSVGEIRELSSDCLGILANGILRSFNRRTEKFIPLIVEAEKDSTLRVADFLPGEGNTCWIVSERSLELYHLFYVKDKQGTVTRITARKEKEYADLISKPETFSEFTGMSGGKGFCLVTNQAQLLLFDPDRPKAMKSVRLWGSSPLTINDVYESDGVVWVSTVSEGILRYHIHSGKVDQTTYGGSEKANKLSHTDAFQVIEINKDRYLAVTWSGYTLLTCNKEHPEELTSEIYNNTASQLYRNLETRMVSAYYDPNGLVWIGTNGGGVMYSDLRSQFYNQYHQERHNEICGIEIDNDDHIWIATFHCGIMRSDEPFYSSKKLSFSLAGTSEIRSKTTVLCTLKDKEGTLWFGNRDGTITSYNQQTKQFAVHSLVEKGIINHSPIWAMYIDKQDRFWAGTEDGLWQFMSSAHSSHRMPVEEQMKLNGGLSIRSIVGTADGTIWIGGGEGLCRMTFHPNGSFSIKHGYETAAGLHAGGVRSLLAATDNHVFIGYSNGFAVFSPEKDKFENFYTTSDGLCSNFTGCISEDDKGRIWLGTNSGIVRYSKHAHLFYNYYISGSNRSATLYKGFLFWGNNKSLTYFNPNDLETYQSSEKVCITSLEVNNRPVEIGESLNGQVILEKGISFTNLLRLSNANRDFAVTFDNLSYSEVQQKYNYRLLPYQENWQIADQGRRASYTNLPAGIYIFEVANIYPDGSNGKVTTLKIEIEPHWSQSTPFRLLLFILFILALAYLWHYVKRRQKRLEHEMQMKHELFTLNMEREKEHQILVERENFFTSAAHELRTPLTLILSPLQELLQQSKGSTPIYNRLLTMYKNASSLHTLVDHFLYLQKIEAGMVKLRLSETDVVSLVNDITDSFRDIAEMKNIHLEAHLPIEGVNLWMDTEKIASALRNLLSNALKYTPSGGNIRVEIHRKQKDEKEFCCITVADNGAGISPELQNRMFDSFITGDNVPNFSTKMGVGLRIVKNTIDLHHGLITVDSTVGKGTTFTLFIPEGKTHFLADHFEMVDYEQNKTSPQQEDTLLHSATLSETSESLVSKKKLLIIEDNNEVRNYVKSLFTHKYIVIESINGKEGVDTAVSGLPDCIISDVMMPEMDGFTCCREIRKRQETAHIPILLLTAKAEDADMLQGTQSGADDYMMKPFNPELLKSKVENLIVQCERLKRIYTKALMLKQDAGEDEKEDAFMQQVINVVETNLSDETFNVKALAEQLNMSQPTLYRKMKQHSDLAVIDIIRSVRVSKAASLIMENRYSVQEISELVGYSDARTLRKHFTEQFGVSPSKYMEGKTTSDRTK